jgi:hypothetical protein
VDARFVTTGKSLKKLSANAADHRYAVTKLHRKEGKSAFVATPQRTG